MYIYNSSTGLSLKFHIAVHCTLQYNLYCRRRDLYGYRGRGSFDTFFFFRFCSMPLMIALDYHSLIMVVPPASAALVPE